MKDELKNLIQKYIIDIDECIAMPENSEAESLEKSGKCYDIAEKTYRTFMDMGVDVGSCVDVITTTRGRLKVQGFNLESLKDKLKIFLLADDLKNGKNEKLSPVFYINNSSNNVSGVNLSMNIETAIKQIEDSESFTSQESQEIIEKIKEIEHITNSTASKKEKWENAKAILKWVADKSFEVTKTILPLLMRIQMDK